MYVDKIRITEDYRCFEAGFELAFEKPITLLVGENGSGKSTLLDMLRDHYGIEDDSYFKDLDIGKYAEITAQDLPRERVKYFDCHAGDRKFATSFGGDMMGQLAAMHASSGQGLMAQLASSGVFKSANSLILLDEIGRGFSPRSNTIVLQMMAMAPAYGCQIIASTHEERIIRALARLDDCALYSVEHRKYMEFDEFLEAHLEGAWDFLK
jgi:predicted ATPase